MAYIDPYESEEARRSELALDELLRRRGLPDPEIRRPSVMTPHAEAAGPSLSVPLSEAAPELAALAGKPLQGPGGHVAPGMPMAPHAIATPDVRPEMPEHAPPPPRNALEEFAAQGLIGVAAGESLGMTPEKAAYRRQLAMAPTRAQAAEAEEQKRKDAMALFAMKHGPNALDQARAGAAQAQGRKYDAQAAKAEAEAARLGRPRGPGGAPFDPSAAIASVQETYAAEGLAPTPAVLHQLRIARTRREMNAAIDDAQRDINSKRSAGAQADKRDRDAEKEASKLRVVGWKRRADAPHMADAEMAKIRNEQFGVRDMERINREVQALSKKITEADIAAAKAGKDTQNIADARALQMALTTALRIAANMGVPSAEEMRVVNEAAPPLDAIAGYMNAQARYQAIAKNFRGRFNTMMDTRGYDPDPGAAKPTGEQAWYRVSKVDPKTGKELRSRRPLTAAQAARLRAIKGFTVEPVE